MDWVSLEELERHIEKLKLAANQELCTLHPQSRFDAAFNAIYRSICFPT